MIEVREIYDKDQKTSITLEIMHALPEWFSPPEDIDRKSVTHREMPFLPPLTGIGPSASSH